MASGTYINQFLTAQTELDRIPGEVFSKSHVVHIFLCNIIDPDYGPTIMFLQNSHADLPTAVSAIRYMDRTLHLQRMEGRRIRQTLR